MTVVLIIFFLSMVMLFSIITHKVFEMKTRKSVIGSSLRSSLDQKAERLIATSKRLFAPEVLAGAFFVLLAVLVRMFNKVRKVGRSVLSRKK